MTRTTAKIGMFEYKVGHGQKDFKYGFLEDIAYNDKVSFKNVLKGYEAQFKQLSNEIDTLKEVDKTKDAKISDLTNHIGKLENKINEIETKYLEALRGLITR